MPEEGRRGRRKRLTRTAISEHGWRLFAARGFDAVTVAEVADAADVAVGTVFNYFPSKEAILFDLADAMIEGMAATVRDRSAGQGVVAAFRQWHDRGIDFLLAGDDRTRRFLELVAESPALRAYQRELDDQFRRTLCGMIAQDAPMPDLLAGQLVTLHRTIADLARDLILAGLPARTLRTRLNAATRTGFDLLAEHVHAVGRSSVGA